MAMLHDRLVSLLRAKVANGESTERSLARQIGLSQPHLHNVLKGVRALSPATADQILFALRISAMDLLDRKEMIDYLSRTNPQREQRFQPIPVLDGPLGPNHPMPRKGPHTAVHAVPYHQASCAADPLVVQLAADPEMEPLLNNPQMVLLDQSEAARGVLQPDTYYVVRTADGPRVRTVRREGSDLLFVSERSRDHQEEWEREPLGGRDVLDVVLARVVWINRRRRWEDVVA